MVEVCAFVHQCSVVSYLKLKCFPGPAIRHEDHRVFVSGDFEHALAMFLVNA
jgi:hypothetical protein